MRISKKLLLASIFFLIFIGFINNAFCEEFTKDKDYIILVHGLCRTAKSMNYLQNKLENKNYNVINFRYDSKKTEIEDITEELNKEIEKYCINKTKKINFVTHSMGGIVVRYYLAKYKPNNIGRIVMLSPPNNGSEIVDVAENSILLKKIFELYNGINFLKLKKNGAFLKQLRTMEKKQKNQYEIGIITGDRSWNPLFSSWITGKDDGKVNIESAKINDMKDYVILHASHTFIMNRKIVFEQILNFLKEGNFKKY